MKAEKDKQLGILVQEEIRNILKNLDPFNLSNDEISGIYNLLNDGANKLLLENKSIEEIKYILISFVSQINLLYKYPELAKYFPIDINTQTPSILLKMTAAIALSN